MERFDRLWANRDGARRLVLVSPTTSEGHSHNGMFKHFGSDEGHSHQQGRDSEQGTLLQRRVLTARKLIEMEPVCKCLHYLLRVGDTPTTGRARIWNLMGDSDQQGGDFERGTLPQQRVSTALS